MSAPTRAEHLAALARQPVDVVPAASRSVPGAAGTHVPNPDRYEPLTLDAARIALRRRPVIVAVSAFGSWRHGELVKAGRTRLAVAYVTTASPQHVHDVTELPAHVYLLRTLSTPALPTHSEEPAMPGRTRKPTTTVAEAASGTTAVLDVAAPPTPAAKAARAKKTTAAADVQALLVASEAGAAGATFIAALPVGRILPSVDNPRTTLPELEELRDSIAEHGVLEPLVVAEQEGALERDEHGLVGGYDLVFGHRRLAAAQAAGLVTVPAVVRNDLVGRRADVARIVENLQRADLTPLEEARAIAALVAGGMAQKEVAVAISRNPGHVSKRLRLLKLPPNAQALVESGALPLDVAVDLSRLPADDQVKIAATGNPSQIGHLVERRADEIKREAELTKVARELEKGGLTVLVFHSYPSTSLHAGPYNLEQLRGAYGYDVPADHRKLPCHAAMVAPSYSLGYVPADELAADPLLAHYRLVCTNPQTHLKPAGKDAAKPGKLTAAEKREQEAREARAAAVTALLDVRWGQAARAVRDMEPSGVAATHTCAVSLVAELGRCEVDEHAWALTRDLLAGEPETPAWYRHEYDTDLPGAELGRCEVDEHAWALTRDLLAGEPETPAWYRHEYDTDLPGARELLALLPDYSDGGPNPATADIERFAYAHALATGHTELRRILQSNRTEPDPDECSLASLHLRHLIDEAGGGIPADPVELQIVMAGARLPVALESWGLLAPPPAIVDVDLPPMPGDDDVDGIEAGLDAADAEAAALAADASVDDASYQRAELGVTREAESDYGIRIGGGPAYLVPGIKTAKGMCARCHAQVTIRSGGLAGKHATADGPCPGAGEPVMTLAQARPEEATGEPADPAVDQVACSTCEGVGRDGQDRRCPDCAGHGLVPAAS